MGWEPWSRKNPIDLVRYVTPLAKRWLPLEANAFDLERGSEGRRELVKSIYSELLKRNIRYALEEYHPSRQLQFVRTPAEVLASPRQGTCLDLATLFCGICLGYELLPMLILTDGHALEQPSRLLTACASVTTGRGMGYSKTSRSRIPRRCES